MRLHSLEHEPFEGLANIAVWAKNKGHSITRTLLFHYEKLPDMSEFDWLVIMGGSMNIYEEDKYRWLKEEKNFIAEAIANKKIVLGVCLGAQLIADVLGGQVSRNRHKEIGWFPVKLTKEAKNSAIFNTLPKKFIAFHWHGDTFAIPPGALKIAESEACANQAFELGKVVGVQFHLDYSVDSINLMLNNCRHELGEEKYIQKVDEIMARIDNVTETQRLLNLLLDNMERELG
jgi:GMP synthase-like glutamine amidotransferase